MRCRVSICERQKEIGDDELSKKMKITNLLP